MNVILEKNGKTVQYKADSALYLLLRLIPFVGGIITLILVITKKQFRGIYLNLLIWALIISFPIVISALISEVLFIVVLLAIGILGLYAFIMYVLNANKYSVKQRLVEGYTVVNINNPEVQQFVAAAEAVKSPFWQFTKF